MSEARALLRTATRHQDGATLDVVLVERDGQVTFDVLVQRSRAHIARIFSPEALQRYLDHGVRHTCTSACRGAM